MLDNIVSIINATAGMATCIALVVAIIQIRHAAREARTAFEDGFAAEYRDLLEDLPLNAMLGREAPAAFDDDSLRSYFRYFDLCNQQAFMYQKDRIGEPAWTDWLEGIRDNMKLPAFAAAWKTIKEARPDCFHELRALERTRYALARTSPTPQPLTPHHAS